MAVETPTEPGSSRDAELDELAQQFREQLGERVLSAEVRYQRLTVTVDAEAFPQVARYCKQDLGMTFFDWLSAVDERDEGFRVVTHLYSHITRQGVILQAAVPGGRDEPRFPTITDVYVGANWHEREAYDMFGIVFDGHPGLLPRILTVENFEGWPLRKEFKLASRVVKPWPGAKEPGEPGEGEGEASATSSSPAPGNDPEDRAAAAKAKAERAKAKAAAARKKKAEEKAAAQAGENPTGSESADSALTPEDGAAAQARDADPAGPSAEEDKAAQGDQMDATEPGSTRDAAQSAAGQDPADASADATTPEGAAEVGDTPAAKDAAAGVTAGQDLAPGEEPDSAEPQRDAEREAEMGAGGPAQDSGAPGVEREGIHSLEDSTVRSDVSHDPAPGDVADREEAGVGPEGGTGTFAESTRQDHAATSAGTDDDVSDASDPDAADAADPAQSADPAQDADPVQPADAEEGDNP